MATIKKYNGSTWENTIARKYETKSEIIVPPTTIYADGSNITTYSIKGNTVQNGTPTPSNPVDVNGVGVRTENLWNDVLEQGTISSSTGQPSSADNRVRSTNGLRLAEGTYTIATDSGKSVSARIYNIDGTYNRSGGFSGNPVSFSLDDEYLVKFIIQYTNDSNLTPSDVQQIMLNSGSTAKPYEPYGYKIPISNGQQTIDIYIGDLPLLKSLDGTAVDEISNGTLTRRVDSDGSVLPTPTTTQITMPSIPTTEGANTITVDTTVQPSEFTATWTGWHDASVKEWDGSIWG